MRRLAAALVVACLLVSSLALPTSASTDTRVLTTTITQGASRTPLDGTFTSSLLCKTGYAGTTEFRCAFEFDLSAIISDTKITAATLTLTRTSSCSTAANNCPITIASYAGNGSADVDDVTAGTTFASWTPTSNTAHDINVLSQIVAHRNNSEQWAGFRLARGASTANPDVQRFSLASTDLKLTITYIPLPVDITVTKDGTGTGKVVSSIAGINCGATCTGTFTYQEPLKLTASVGSGNIFVGWSGITCEEGVQTGATCSFNVPSVPDPIVATFTSTATPKPSAHATATPKPTAHASKAPTAPTTAPQTQAPSAAPAPTEIAQATFAPGQTVGPTLAPAPQPTSDSGGGLPIGPIILILGIVLAIGAGVGAYLYARSRQGTAPPG